MRSFDRQKIIANTKNYGPLHESFIDINKPVAFEIGAGTGMHSMLFAKNNPNYQVIGRKNIRKVWKI